MSLIALLFDVDGTLAETERDGHRVAFNQAFAEAGLDWEWSVDLYGELLAITGGKERMRHYLQAHRPDEFKERSESGELDSLIPRLHQAKTRFYTELLSHGDIPLRPGVERLFHEAMSAGIRLAIATTTTPANVTALLTHTLGKESIGWFDIIAAGDIVPAKKPAPDIYDYALKERQWDAANCIAFEDSENGIQSSHGANLTTIITVNDYTREHDFSGAHIVLEHLGEPGNKPKVYAGDLGQYECVDLEYLKEITG